MALIQDTGKVLFDRTTKHCDNNRKKCRFVPRVVISCVGSHLPWDAIRCYTVRESYLVQKGFSIGNQRHVDGHMQQIW